MPPGPPHRAGCPAAPRPAAVTDPWRAAGFLGAVFEATGAGPPPGPRPAGTETAGVPRAPRSARLRASSRHLAVAARRVPHPGQGSAGPSRSPPRAAASRPWRVAAPKPRDGSGRRRRGRRRPLWQRRNEGVGRTRRLPSLLPPGFLPASSRRDASTRGPVGPPVRERSAAARTDAPRPSAATARGRPEPVTSGSAPGPRCPAVPTPDAGPPPASGPRRLPEPSRSVRASAPLLPGASAAARATPVGAVYSTPISSSAPWRPPR